MTDHDRPPWETAGPPPPPRQGAMRGDRRRTLMSAAVVVTAAAGVAITYAFDRQDAAVLFVGLPALLALGIALRPPARTLHGAVASGTSFALLLAAMLLQEGAICVVMSAPLVFGVAHGIAAVTARLRGRHQAALVLPLVLLASFEGIVPTWRVAPVQTAEVATIVAADVDTVLAALLDGPDLASAHRPLLLRTGFPVPTQATGDGLDVGDRWEFDYRGHPIVTEVIARADGEATFALVHDGSKTARWLTWRHATLRWRATSATTTEVRIAVTFERGLDPSWWFGPIEDAFVSAGAELLLDGLVGELRP